MHRLRPGDRRRRRAPLSHWLLVRSRPGRLEGHSSTRRPAVQRGDLAVCYLAGVKRIFAVVEVVSDPENDPARARWGWRFALRLLLHVDPLDGPPVEAAGVLPRSLGRHSYIRLTREQFDAAREAIAGVSDPPGAGSGMTGHAHAGRAPLREG